MEADEVVQLLRECVVLDGHHEGPVRAVRFNSDGNYCVTCGSDKTLRLWNPHSKIHLKAYVGHGYEVLDAESSNENDKIVSCGADKTVILWDVATGKLIRRFRGHLGKVNCVKSNHPDFTVLVSGSYDATVRCWDTRSRSQDALQVMNEAKDSVSSVQVTESSVVAGSVDGFIREYDLRQGRMVEDCMGEPVTSVLCSSDGQCLLVSTLDNTIRLIDRFSGELLNSFKGHKNLTYKIDSCLLNNDSFIASGSEDGYIYFWDLIEAKVVHKIKQDNNGIVYSMSVHPNKNCLLTASSSSVKLWTDTVDS